MPRRPIEMPDLETLEGLVRLGVTQTELAQLQGCSQPAIAAKLAREPYKTVWQRGQAEMKVSIRRGLMRAAERGNVAASIFLARTVLKMVEPPRDTHIQSDLKSDIQVRWIAEFRGSPPEALPPADDIDLLEGEADEE